MNDPLSARLFQNTWQNLALIFIYNKDRTVLVLPILCSALFHNASGQQQKLSTEGLCPRDILEVHGTLLNCVMTVLKLIASLSNTHNSE